MDLNTEGGDVLLFELSGQMSLNEGGFSNTTVTDKDEFELNELLVLFHFLYCKFFGQDLYEGFVFEELTILKKFDI